MPVFYSLVTGSPRKRASSRLGVTCGVAPTDPRPIRSRSTSGHLNEADTADMVASGRREPAFPDRQELTRYLGKMLG